MEAADSPAYWERYEEAEERASFRERMGAFVLTAAAAVEPAAAASMSLLEELEVVETISMSSSIDAQRAEVDLEAEPDA